MKNTETYVFMGTAAEFIKMAPVLKELKARKTNFKLVTSGQTKIYFEDFYHYLGKIEPYYRFEGKVNRSSMLYFIVWAIKTFFRLLLFLNRDLTSKKRRDTYFVIHGDTVSSLLGAIAASILGLRVVHVESGLRSFNFFEPFPEEICRFVVSKIASIHFCPNSWAVKNLRRTKGIKIDTKQNIFIESFLWAVKSHPKPPIKVRGKYFVLVVHRQEHVIFGKQKTIEILNHIFKKIPKGVSCVFLIHELTKNILNTGFDIKKLKKSGVIFIPRLPFVNFVNLLKESEFIITDGGSNQEEAYYMGKPCLILRNVTERIEGLRKNALIASGDKFIINEFIENYTKYKTKETTFKVSPSKLIVDYLIGT